MKTYGIRYLIVLIYTFLPLSSFASEHPAATAYPSKVLYFSVVPKKNFDQQIRELRPLIDLLEKDLQKSIKIIRSQSYTAVIEGILSKTIDFAILGPASYAKAKARDNGIEAFASFARKKGAITPKGSYYYSVLFSLKKNGFESVKDVRRKKIALTDPASTSGSVIPNMAFSKHIGKSLKDYFGTIIYTGSHDRSIRSVLREQVHAAFVSSARIDEAINKQILYSNQVKILWQSDPIHRDPFVFSSGVDNSVKNQIKRIMFSPSSSLESMLQNMNMAGIVAVSDEDYNAIHEIISIQSRKK
ncbi:phosphate/phosphite/phosphonate ABC transporter substrate-binding protein [Desulfobacter latus]|uniref:Phosphate/phosphite/phosphonate ABC transporter substrate-binding protein n=1 Tax=Desulfobacter latus TaxID=2292 RepID=A0A850SVS5_9BACT|nr:phosphate/phosphite/phosphonate ABC transporter substrate-binding protein [Desulfobacter latus]NWH04180.1 phosphate/phosphite/phosphonate ABC transporter substrate-binding protein [Desulfobacter latus]